MGSLTVHHNWTNIVLHAYQTPPQKNLICHISFMSRKPINRPVSSSWWLVRLKQGEFVSEASTCPQTETIRARQERDGRGRLRHKTSVLPRAARAFCSILELKRHVIMLITSALLYSWFGWCCLMQDRQTERKASYCSPECEPQFAQAGSRVLLNLALCLLFVCFSVTGIWQTERGRDSW